MNKKELSKVALSGLIAAGTSIISLNQAVAADAEMQCKGVSTKWTNSCKANGHSCAGKAKKNFDKEEWMELSAKDCKVVQEAVKNPVIQKYIESIQQGTVVAAKRGKKF